MARNYTVSLLAVSMLLCTLTLAGAQQPQGAQQTQAKPQAKPAAKPKTTQPAAQPQQQAAQPPQPVQQPRPNVGDDIPQSWGGLPQGAPARQKVIEPTPAVHDLPPPRATKPLNDDAQLKLEKELDEARTRTNKRDDPNIEKRGRTSTAANAAALEEARKKAGNPKPKEPKAPKPAKEPEPKP